MIPRILMGLLLVFCSTAAAEAPAAGPEEPLVGIPQYPFLVIDVQDSPSVGPENAPVTVVEFSDFQCPYSARTLPTLKTLLQLYPGRVRWVFKHFPLQIHSDAPLAHEAVLAAHKQGRFLEMYDLLLSNQGRLKRDDLIRYAGRLGLDLPGFTKELDSGRLRTYVLRDTIQGRNLQVDTTPTYFINGNRMVGTRSLTGFRQVIDRELDRAAAIAQVARPQRGPMAPGR